MRKLLLFPAILIGITAPAQVTLTSAVHGWLPGDNYNYTPCDTVGINPGPSGTGQTWNFAALNVNGTPATSTYVAPSSTPYAASFPTSTVANGASGSYYFYQANAGGISIVGLGTPSYIMTYSNTDQLMSFPFAYGNSFSDTHAASYTIASYTGTRGGSTTVNADGSGTLVLPSGSYAVLRLKTIQVDNDSLLTTGINTTSTVYSWFSATQKFPLMQIQFISQDNGSSTTYTKVVYVNSNVVGMETHSLLTGMNLFPNPASGDLNVSAMLDQPSTVSIELFDLSGRIVLQEGYDVQPAGEFKTVLNVADFAPGMYSLRIRAGESESVQKVNVR